MMHRSCSPSTSAPTRKRGVIPAIALVLATTVPAFAQNAPAPAGPLPDSYSPYELNLFMGYQHFFLDNRDAARDQSFNGGITGGFRITEDFWKYAGIEESLSIAGNNLAVI